MKKCPYCEAEISNNAKKCKHCWEVVVEEKMVRQCPYCEAEVSETAKKCKHCWEWLNEIDENYNNEENNPITKKTTISLGNALKLFLVIWIMVELFCLFVYLNKIGEEYEKIIKLDNMDYRLAFPGFLSVIIIFILLVVRSVKTYKILLSSNTKKLQFKSTAAVWWWWFIPIVCLYRPYQAVKDILKNLELKNNLNSNTSIVWWWWAMFLFWSFLSRWYISYIWHGNYDTMVLDIIIAIFSIIEYILLFKIIERVNIAQEKYMYNTCSTENKTSFIVWIIPIMFIIFMISFLLYFYS